MYCELNWHSLAIYMRERERGGSTCGGIYSSAFKLKAQINYSYFNKRTLLKFFDVSHPY